LAIGSSLNERRPAGTGGYDRAVLLSWKIAMVILIACLLASIVIAAIKL
jgi:hypothetical protein